MGAEIINLRQARKSKARAAKDALAVENRVKFGRTKAEKLQSAGVEALSNRRLDLSKIDQTEIVTRESDEIAEQGKP